MSISDDDIKAMRISPLFNSDVQRLLDEIYRLRAVLAGIREMGCDRDCYYYATNDPCPHERAREALG